MATKSNLLILGASHAGVQLAASLRAEGYEGAVQLISNEPHLPYHRPPLSKAYLKDLELGVQGLRAAEYFDDHGIELINNAKAAEIDCDRQQVALVNGDTLSYSKLCIATGARPRELPLNGMDAKGIYYLRDANEAQILREASRNHQRVVVIGGGFIGLEAAATLCQLGLNVRVVEAAPRLMGRAVAPEISSFVHEKLQALGIEIFVDCQVTGIDTENDKVQGVVCGDKQFPADMVLVGIGVIANDDIAGAAGITIGNGIHVDARLRTSNDKIYAIGDVAAMNHWLVGERIRIESVQNATDQAKSLAKEIVGEGLDYRAVPWFWSDQGDMKLQMVGLSHRSHSRVSRDNPKRGGLSVFHFDEAQKLIAIDTINVPGDHMAGRKIIAKGASPTLAQAGDPDFSLKILM